MDQMEMSVKRRQWRGLIRLRRYMTRPVWVTALLSAWLFSFPAVAGSNLDQDYPAHQCGEKPEPPQRPDKFRYRAELDAYNEKVHAYNALMEQYVICLRSYVDNAASDIRAIRDGIEAALEAVKP
jgi:hypothetical protein